MSAGFAPLRDGAFLPLGEKMRAAVARRLQPERLVIEIATQLAAFLDTFGRPPDFLDGHQHVHLFPQVRDAFLKVVAEAAPLAWVRQCGRANSAAAPARSQSAGARYPEHRFSPPGRSGSAIATNSAFAGSYDFNGQSEFRQDFPAVPDRAAGRRADHVSSRLRRCRAKKARIRSRRSANGSLPTSIPINFRTCWRGMASRLPNRLALTTRRLR